MVAECCVACFALATAVHAVKNKEHWPALLVSATLAGQLGERLLVRYADRNLPYYVSVLGIYEAFYRRGAEHLLVLIPLLVIAVYCLWRERSLVARARPSWLGVAFAAFFHGLAFWMAASSGRSDVLSLAVIATNAGLSVTLQLWSVLFATAEAGKQAALPC